jgi:hypothetical protein
MPRVVTEQNGTIYRKITTLQATMSTMSSAYDRWGMQPSDDLMEMGLLQERYKTSARISKIRIKEMTMEIKELKAKLTTYEVEVRSLQSKTIRGENYCGRNSTHFSKLVSWGNNDGANNKVVTQFCKSKLFPDYKFLHQGWVEYSADDTLSLCYKIFNII